MADGLYTEVAIHKVALSRDRTLKLVYSFEADGRVQDENLIVKTGSLTLECE